MSSVHADRNLLYGLLALQMDFVSKDGLIEAMQAWALDKGRPLEAILGDRGLIGPEDHAVLEPLLRRHLARHGGDPEKSLSAVAAPAEVRDDLRALADPEVTASLGRLATPNATPTPPTDDGPTPLDPAATLSYVGLAGGSAGRFRVVRPHARGGLGEVFVALDTELNREVALKQILGHRADGEADRRRFVFEAEVTGGLEHPGIVPVYSLGRDQGTGRPYYAMRLIRGDSLRDAIAAYHAAEARRAGPADRSLGLRRLVTRLIDACNAVAYAHDRGVLHRDLKPSNVMVGKYGETLVVDWGLAKVVGRPDAPASPLDEPTLRPPSAGGKDATLPGSAIGTPPYMPPEQADGRLDLIGPASDVYSLGAILYTLLTGRLAFPQATRPEVLAAVRRGAFEPPRAVDPAIPRPLEAICLKAMAHDPAGRYPSAAALAEDLEHWLGDEPVSARPDPPLVRLGRWSRRHRPLVAGLAGLVLATTIGLAVGAVLLRRANVQIERNYEQAEANYRLAREAVDRFYTTVSEDTLLNEPHMERLRRELLESAREFYERFASRRAGDPRSLADLGAALLRLSDIDRDLGALTRAIAHAERARRLFGELSAEHPEAAEYRGALAESDDRLGVLYRSAGRDGEAEESFRLALSQEQRLVDDHPAVAEHRRRLATGHNNLGNLYLRAGRLAAAESSYRRALEQKRHLVGAFPRVAQYRLDLSRTLINLGALCASTGRIEEAESFYRDAVDLRERLAGDDPDSLLIGLDLARSLSGMAELQGRAGKPAEAEASCRRAVEVQERLAVDHPDISGIRRDLAATYAVLGVLQSRPRRTSESEASYRRVVELAGGLAAERPAVTEDRIRLAFGCIEVAEHRAAVGDASEAEALYRRALTAAEQVAHEHPDHLDGIVALGRSQSGLGRLALESGDPERAVGWYDQARATMLSVLHRERRYATADAVFPGILLQRSIALDRLGRGVESYKDLEWSVFFAGGPVADLHYARSLALAGDHARAAAEASAALTDRARTSPGAAYLAACVFALAASAAQSPQTGRSIESSSTTRVAQRLADRAVALLRAARVAGYFDAPALIAQMDADPDLDPIREHPAYRSLRLDLAFPADPFAGGG